MPLVNFTNKPWKITDGRTHYFYGHVQELCHKLPEGNGDGTWSIFTYRSSQIVRMDLMHRY